MKVVPPIVIEIVLSSVTYPSLEIVRTWVPGEIPDIRLPNIELYPTNSPSMKISAPAGLQYMIKRLPVVPGRGVVVTAVVIDVVSVVAVVAVVAWVSVGTVVTVVVGEVPLTRVTLGGVAMPSTGTVTVNV